MATCPTCKGPCKRYPENPSFPFCSGRCKLADLGNWLGGAYAIAAEPADPHAAENADAEEPRTLH